MKLNKIDGKYVKPGLRRTTTVPFYVWFSGLLIVFGLLAYVIYRTDKVQEALPESLSIRKHVYRLVAVGDIACQPSDPNFNDGQGVAGSCHQKDVGRAVEAEKADAVLLLGDIQYNSGEFSDFEQSFVPYWRDIKKPIYVTAGNHDYGETYRTPNNLDGYNKAFDTYFEQSTTQKAGKTYYDFGFGSWDAYALDTNCEFVGGCNKESDQYKWLTNQVEKNPVRCSIAMWHHPVYTSGAHKEVASTSRGADFLAYLESQKTDIVLNGHDHNYERILLPGSNTREFVVGTGGMTLRKTSAPLAIGSEKIIEDKFGYLYLELYPGRYTWQFKDTTGAVLDSGSDTCK